MLKLCEERALPEKYYSFTKATLTWNGRSAETYVSRSGYTGSFGYEILCKAEDTVWLWDTLLEAGKDFGLIPCGLGARDTLRLEAAMPLYGHELTDNITPKMASLPCKLDGKDFIGHDALVKLGAPEVKRVGLKGVGRGIVREHCDLYSAPDGEKIGWALLRHVRAVSRLLCRDGLCSGRRRGSRQACLRRRARPQGRDGDRPHPVLQALSRDFAIPLLLCLIITNLDVCFCLFRIFSVLRFFREWRILPAE